jgi:acyl-CoA synthetase (AMP-forming)/AMP-acid ligase II
MSSRRPNLASLLVEHPFAADDPLLLTGDQSVTAGEARSAAAALAARLRDAGLRPGQAVAVRGPNGPDLVITMVGVWLAGGVFVPVNDRAPADELARVLAAVRPALVIDGAGLEVCVDPGDHGPDAAFVLWTSGTTGVPKAIVHTHEAYLELLDRVLGPLRAKVHDAGHRPTPNLIPVSLALNAGIYNVLFGLRAGAAIVIMERFEPSTFAALVPRFGITSTVLAPAQITMLCDEPTISSLEPLRYVRSITAPLSPLQARRFTDRFGVFVLNGYGQAEIGEVIGWTAADAKAHPDKVGAVGRPHPGVAVKVVGDDGAPRGEDEVGELLVKPPRMAAGYAGTGGADAFGERLDPHGFVRTGDLARVDADGFVWIEGRIGDVINRGGNKVFPEHVEEVLRLAPGVRDAAVVGVPDDRLGEVPVAFVVADRIDAGELEGLCREHLVPYKVPVAFHGVDALPRSDVGKVLRRELVRRAEALPD